MYRQTLVTVALLTACAAPAAAQVDPLLFLKRSAPNVLVMVDTGNRMQRDAPTDPANPTTSNYYDPIWYPRTLVPPAWESTTLKITPSNTTNFYRRRYDMMALESPGSTDKFTTPWISVVSDHDLVTNPKNDPSLDARSSFATFEAPTRLSVARAALYQAIQENQSIVRFGLYKMRQNNLTLATPGNSGPVLDTDPMQNQSGLTDAGGGKWNISSPSVSGANGAVGSAAAGGAILVAPDASNANTTVLSTLWKDTRTAGGLLPAGQDDADTTDEPVKLMLDDVKADAVRLIAADSSANLCRNTVAILITGGGEGNTTPGADPAATASTFLTASAGRRIPIIVIAIAPPSADVPQLQRIASNSGGQYFEISKVDIDAALASSMYSSQVLGTVIVPSMVRALNVAVQTAFQSFSDLNTGTWSGPWLGWTGYAGSSLIPSTEYQVTSPIIGTVNLENAKDITGAALPLTTVNDKANNKIPQRSNLMVTSGFVLPGFDGILRGFRMYKPQADATQPSGYKFVADGTRLWVASTPPDPAQRNLYTALADGTVIAFNSSNAATLAPLMNMNSTGAAAVIDYIRSQPIGAIVDSTPAIMNAPSLDPPPDDDYPAFAVANKNRRSIVWVGTNRGILEGIDARLGVEVWGFIPLNLLPKLKTVRDGQPVEKFDYFVDGSAKVADVKIDNVWKTYLIMGEGPGGTFYQTFDVTMRDMANAVAPDSDSLASVLSYFSDPRKIQLVWEFPRYSMFDPRIRTTATPYGDVSAGASALEKTVGQTWSDPAVGEVTNSLAPYAVIIGSGFLPYSAQQQANRGGKVAGTTFYILNVKDGTVYDSMDVASDGLNETVDDCTSNSDGCKKIKNALQTDPVATGPSDSRFITKAYIGDLDGNLWKFDVGLDASLVPKITATTKLYAAGSDQPIFSSMATVNVGGTKQYVFYGTGSDLLPGTASTTYHLLGVLDNGATGTKTMDQVLTKTVSGNNITADERVTAFPAVAGDIVFFTTTTFKPSTPCSLPDANLYAFTFIGGPAYDNTGDNRVGKTDTPLVKTVAGVRATAPFIVDQHLVFGVSPGKVELFGDPQDFNNGIGQAGVRILSWRQVR